MSDKSPLVSYGGDDDIEVYGGNIFCVKGINILGVLVWLFILWFIFVRPYNIPEYFNNSNVYNEQYLVNLTGGRTQGVYAGTDGYGLNYQKK